MKEWQQFEGPDLVVDYSGGNPRYQLRDEPLAESAMPAGFLWALAHLSPPS